MEVHVVRGNPNPSHVLQAIGNRGDELEGVLRISFGLDNTKEDVDYLVKNLTSIIRECKTNNSFDK